MHHFLHPEFQGGHNDGAAPADRHLVVAGADVQGPVLGGLTAVGAAVRLFEVLRVVLLGLVLQVQVWVRGLVRYRSGCCIVGMGSI